MLTVHHLNNSRSQRILWLLVGSISDPNFLSRLPDTQEELEIPYEIKKYYRTTQQLAPPELLSISPLGKSPVITDGNVTLAESGAIIGMCVTTVHLNHSTDTSNIVSAEYLISKYGNGRFQATEAGYLDNLYCTRITSVLCPFVRRMPAF
jgi:glutathione S-transferase